MLVNASARRVATACYRHGHRLARIFGWMGVPMALVFLLSAAWTAMLAAIQLAPSAVANYLMGTADFDYGEFWLLSRANDGVAVPAAALLVLVAAAYVALVLRMVFPDDLLRAYWRRSICSRHSVTVQPLRVGREKKSRDNPLGTDMSVVPVDSPGSIRTTPVRSSRWRQLLASMRRQLNAPADNSALALPKLVLQSTTLVNYLRDGFPTFLILHYAALLTVNWWIACYRTLHTRPDPRFVLRRVFFSFDLFFAVLAPLLVLVYAYYHFAFDRDVFATRTATLNPGSFDGTARLFADPTQVSLFRIAFQNMQLTSVPSFLIKAVLNVFTIRKWHETIVALIALERPHGDITTAAAESASSVRRGSATTEATIAPAAAATTPHGSEQPTLSYQQRCQRALRMLSAATFFAAGIGLFVYTVVAVVSSRRVCRVFPLCQVPSYKWHVGATSCACIVFVDRHTLVASYAEWTDLTDTTAHLAALAATGDLRIVQIINRQLPHLPEELRNCRELEQLILIHTRTIAFPDWAASFTQLRYLNVEGDDTPTQLTYLPRDLFADMPRLQFLHLGTLLHLPELPRFQNLPRLQYLVLAMLHSINEIPSLDHLTSLRQLNIIDAIRVPTLPPVWHLDSLSTFVLVARNPMCCNGFMTGTCNLTESACLDRSAAGEPRVECANTRIARDDYARLTATQGVICARGPPMDLKDLTPTMETIDRACGGVLYRQCKLGNGATGMCFPARMQPVSCQPDPTFTNMRRLQIQRRVGDVCDVVEEAWLGCGGTN